MPSILSKLVRDGIIDNNGSIDEDKLAERILNDRMYMSADPPPPPLKRRRTRTERPRRNYKQSPWYVEYIVDADNLWNDPDNDYGKMFKQRFFLNKAQVIEVASAVKEANIWTDGNDAVGRSQCPIELLVLASLRILTRNWTYCCCNESTWCSKPVIRAFFKKFVKWFSGEIFDTFVKMPDPTQDAVNHNGYEYTKAGIPGTIGSIDCVHIRLWNCPASLRQFATGKEKYPSRAYEVMVNHRKLILNVSIGFYGSITDTTIVRFDGGMIKVKSGLYNDCEFQLYNSEGVLEETIKGVHTINDNGYDEAVFMMEPTKSGAKSNVEKAWSKMIESLRKVYDHQ